MEGSNKDTSTTPQFEDNLYKEEQKPWYKNQKVIVPLAVIGGAVVFIGALVGGLAGAGVFSPSGSSEQLVEDANTKEVLISETDAPQVEDHKVLSKMNDVEQKKAVLEAPSPKADFINSMSDPAEFIVTANPIPEMPAEARVSASPFPKLLPKNTVADPLTTMVHQGVHFKRPADPNTVKPDRKILQSMWDFEEFKSKIGDGICGRGEWCKNSPDDCPCIVDCGNGICDSGETHENCAIDCIFKHDYCGDGLYDPPINSQILPYTDLSENPATCPLDAPEDTQMVCGDGVCGYMEGCFYCPEDCGVCPPVCGDGKCDEETESCSNCARDCGLCPAIPDDGVCNYPYETPINAPVDCKAVETKNQILFEGTRFATMLGGEAENMVYSDDTCESAEMEIPRGWRIASWAGEDSRVGRLLAKYPFETPCLIFADGTNKPSAGAEAEWCANVHLTYDTKTFGKKTVAYNGDWFCPSRILIEAIEDTIEDENREKVLCPGNGNCFGNGICDDYNGVCHCNGRWTGEACERAIGDFSIPESENDWFKPTRGVTWQWHLDGPMNNTFDVDIYDIDVDLKPESIKQLKDEGRRVICYFSAGSWEAFRPDEAQLLKEVRGGPLIFGEGDVFYDEAWLDLRRPDIILPVMLNRIDYAKKQGCEGIEFDNPDIVNMGITFPSDDGMVDLAQQFYYNLWLVRQTHARGMAVALKNSYFFASMMADDYDMVVNEECNVLQNCHFYWPFLERNKPVLNTEYLGSRCFYCEKANRMGLSTIKKRPALTSCMVDCRTSWSDKVCMEQGWPENQNLFPNQNPDGWCPMMKNNDHDECTAPRYAQCYPYLSY